MRLDLSISGISIPIVEFLNLPKSQVKILHSSELVIYDHRHSM